MEQATEAEKEQGYNSQDVKDGGAVMRCYVCDAVGNWHRPVFTRDGKVHPIHSEMTTQICRNCGAACHNVDVTKEAEIKEFYRRSYRPKPALINLITTTHKLNYVRVFLKDFLKERKDRQLIVGDVGAATGYMLNFFAQLGHKVTGCELTLTYRRMSEHYYGIPLTEELEPKHKYDLINIYHVLEHMMEPDKKLKQYVDMLAPGGHMMVATPEWFDVLEEAAGLPIRGFEHLFHKNHINLFSKASLQNLFKKAGLQVVKEDFLQYGQTYLLKKRESPVPDGWLAKEDYREVERTMFNHKAAIEHYMAGRFRDAFQLVPRFPDAWVSFIYQRCLKDVAKQQDMWEEAAKHVGETMKFVISRGQWNYQRGNLVEALADFQRVAAVKPNEDNFMFMGYCLTQAGRPVEAKACFLQAQAMDPQKWAEANTWILNGVSEMPTWDERLLAEAQNAFKPKLFVPEEDCCNRHGKDESHAPGCKSGKGGPVPEPSVG